MSFEWKYPIYLIPHGGGYASVVAPNAEFVHHLIVYDDAQLALQFMHDFSILAAPREINSGREFLWLLESLQAPVTQVSFNPDPNDDGINARWSVSVRELIDEHLTIEFSPWNYPVHVVALEVGFVCIDGQSNDGQDLTAIGVFSTEDAVKEYLDVSKESGTTCTLNNVEEANRFFAAIAEEIPAVALDPIIEEGRQFAKHCFEMQTLLEKYLVSSKPSEAGP